MPTLLTHIEVKPGSIARWEEILRVLVQRTHAEEKDWLRYEYWRGETAGRYYALLSYPTAQSFYAHQASDYHDAYVDDFAAMFADMRLEWVDPVEDGGSSLPPTRDDPLGADASPALRAQVPLYPILIADWWRMAGAGSKKT